jgi:hypothetical protein
MNEKQRQTEHSNQPSERDAEFESLVDLVADSMRHAISVQVQAKQAVEELQNAAIAQKEFTADLSADMDKLVRNLPGYVLHQVGEKFNEAAVNAAGTISQRLNDANQGVKNAAVTLIEASSNLRSEVEAEGNRRILIGGICFLFGSLFGAFLVWMFGH